VTRLPTSSSTSRIIGFVERLADVDDAEAYCRHVPRRGF
jgi:hypothetical protein